jgi:AraC family transcriptional regulator of adaptative response/methylated-DNA-[protein]-cysteine methyltransferase
LQRQFKSVVGISPAEYAEASRMDRVKAALRGGCPINSALYEAGFGSSSRLYSKSASQMGMTPRSYRNGGQGSEVHYTVVQCPLGLMLVAATERGICAVKFGDVEGELEQGLSSEFSQAHISRDDMAFREWVSVMLRHMEGKRPHLDLPLDVRATAFQKQVWQALQAIPYGETRTYSEIAAELGMPGAARAVGHVCATNPVSVIIPCHRVVRSDGGLGGYRWGLARKEALLRQEGAGREHQDGEESKASYRRR